MIMSMRRESGEIASDREEILKNMHKFLQVTLYPNSANTRKYNEFKSCREVPEFKEEEEVERAIKKVEKTKSPRNGWNHK